MSKVHEKKPSGKRHHRKPPVNRNRKSSSLQGPSKRDEVLSSLENQRQRWRKIIITLTIILLLAGVIIIIVPILVSSNGVPVALPILGGICLMIGILLPVCFFYRKRLTRSCYDEEDKHSLYHQHAGDPENAIGEYQRSSNAANISFDSELGSANGGCLQTTPKIFRFSKSKQMHNHRFRPPPQYQPSNNIPMREKASSDSNNSRANGENRNDGLQFPTQEQSLEKRADNTNLAFIGDEECREIGTKYETNDQIANKNHVLDINTGDGYFTTEEVDVDEELNNSSEIHDNSSSSVNFPNIMKTPNETIQQNSFISRKMFSNFQNSGKSKSNQNKKSNKSSIFSFKIKKSSPKRSEAKGQHNPLSVTDDLAPPSIVISPPTPSPKMSPVSSDNSPPLEQERQVLPPSPVKEEPKVIKKDKKKEPRKERQPNHRFSKNNNSVSTSSNKTSKRKEKNKPKSEGKSKQSDEMTLNEDTIYHFRDAEDDDPSDVVILAEAVISPAEVHKQPEKRESEKKEATSKRSIENEIDNRPSKKKEKGNISSNVFKIFNNNRKESDRGKRNKKIKRSQEANDNYLITAEAIKDSYIHEYSDNKETTSADREDSSDESPPLNNFRNLKSNPDLAGLKFKNLREMKKHNDRLNEDDGSESGFSDVLKYVRKDEKKTGKIKKKKGKKTVPTSSTKNNNYQAPKSRSIEEMNRKLVSISASSSAASTPDPTDSVDKKLLETSLYVSFNPEGRLQRRHGGSMDSVDSAGATSIGSTGSYSGSTGSAGSIVNPMRSSMKKTKSRDRTDSLSTSSGKKSVHYAIGAEQTTV